ncbi:MAG: PxxKW family cysteine-rich protein [Syntrophobacteraceae bacterium]
MSPMNLEKQPIVDKCIGCANIEGEFCSKWASPATKWRLGTCPSATHIKVEVSEPGQKVRVGQQKQKKK